MSNIPLLILLSACVVLTAAETYEGCDVRRSNKNASTQINCVGRQLKAILPNWPPHGDSLLEVDMSNNKISRLNRVAPSQAASIALTFKYCGIIELDSGLFRDTLNVTYVDFSYNRITTEQLNEDVFKGPYNQGSYEPIALQYLNLAYNDIHSLRKNLFEHMPNLTVLILEGNRFNVLDQTTCLSMGALIKLEELNLANNSLTEVPLSALNRLKQLIKLNIADNDFDFVPYSIREVSDTLEELSLDNNPILEIDDQSFIAMSSLLRLSANNLTNLKHIKTNAFNPLINLKYMDLSYCRNIIEMDDEAFGSMESLNELNMNDMGLTEIPLNLIDWSQLHVLKLDGNDLICNCELYNITTRIPKSIKISREGPYCYDYKKSMTREMYTMTDEVCSETETLLLSDKGPYSRVRIMRVAMTTMSVIFVVMSCVAVWMFILKYKGYRRNADYSFASGVTYNPINAQLAYNHL